MTKTLFALFALSTLALSADEQMEPPLRYTLMIGKHSHEIFEGQPIEIGDVRPNEKAVLTVDDYRIFPHQGLKFRYPRYFSFEANLKKPSALNWTLSGNDCKIMLFAFSDKIAPQEFAESFAGKFGKDTNISKVDVRLGTNTYTGVKVDATIAGNRMMMDILPLPAASANSKLLVIQDSVADGGMHSDEYTKLRSVLEESFLESK